MSSSSSGRESNKLSLLESGDNPVVSQPSLTQNEDSRGIGPRVCPPGLEFLTAFDELAIHRKHDLTECRIEDKSGQKIYYSDESKNLVNIYCESSIFFETHIFDNFNNEVICFLHPPACNICCWPFHLQKLEVFAPPETPVGLIRHKREFLGGNFDITNENEDTVLTIKGPRCPSGYTCRNVEFLVMLPDGKTQLGNITKLWIGIEELDDHYKITFPVDLDVKVKVLLLGACFLIDVMFYARSRAERCVQT